ncbi:T9SS type A sorting domain-containing protein [Bacteroidota bacterium]
MKNILLYTALTLLLICSKSKLTGQINIRNADFEKGNDGQVESWEKTAWHYADSLFKWEEGSGRNNSNCISITVDPEQPNDAAFIQLVFGLEPNSWYKLKGWIKCENVEPTNIVGANLSIYGGWVHSKSLTETEDWTEISVYVKSDEYGRLNIGCRLGFWGNTASGKAWFDDISLEEFEPLESEYLTYIFDDDDLAEITEENLERWFNHMDSAYIMYHDLTGYYPYNGDKIGIMSVDYYPGGLAIAGNPIIWYKPYVGPTLRRINDEDEWSFAMLHELGHDYDDNGWNFDAEVFANYKMYYILETLNAKVWASGNYYTGTEIAELYHGLYDTQKQKYAETGDVSGYGGALLYRFVTLADTIGWDAHKQAFRYLYSLPDSAVAETKVEKYFQFIETLSNYSGKNVYDLIPQDDMNEFVAYLGDGYVNQIPEVYIGKDTIVSFDRILTLNPVCSDDNYPNESLTYKWKKLNENDDLLLSNTSSKNIQIEFLQKGEFDIELMVSDGQSRAKDTITITAHEEPTAYIGRDTILAGHYTLYLYPDCSDDGYPNKTLQYNWIKLGGNNGFSVHKISSSDVKVTFYLPGIYKLALNVFDGHLTASDTIQITVNGQPEVFIGADTIVNVEETLLLYPICTDDSYPNDYLEYNWIKIGEINGFSISETTNRDINVDFNQPGQYSLALNISDGQLFASDTINIVANGRPDVLIGNDTIVPVESELYIHPSYSDDGYPYNNLDYEWIKLDGNEDFSVSKAISADVKVSFNNSGIYRLAVNVSDGHRMASDTITITANGKPKVNVGNDTIVSLENTLHLVPDCNDDGYPSGNLTYSWSKSGGTNGFSLSDTELSETFVIFEQSGRYSVVLNVNDGHQSDSDTINIIANQKPLVNAGDDASIFTNEPYTINGQVEDDELPYNDMQITWKALNEDEKVLISDETTATPTVTINDPGVYYLELQVSDGHRTNSDTVQVSVEVPSNINSDGNERNCLSVYPNPVSQNSQITFSLEKNADVELSLYDLLGKRIGSFAGRYYPKGTHELNWASMNPNKINPGIYHLVLKFDNNFYGRKIVVME